MTHNNNENYQPLWNFWLLGMAIVGFFWGIRRGGEYAALAYVAAVLFSGSCVLVGFVYYINPNYAFVPQISLVMLAVLAADMAAYAGSRVMHMLRHEPVLGQQKLPTLTVSQKWAIITFALIFGMGFAIVHIPTVNAYLSPPLAIDTSFPAPRELNNAELDLSLKEFQALPPATQQAFLRNTHQALAANVREWVAKNLQALNFTAYDKNTVVTFYVSKDVAQDAYEAVRRPAQFVIGWHSEEVHGFDWHDPESWDGRRLFIRLDKTEITKNSNFWPLVKEKFARWHWKLQRTDTQIIAVHEDVK